MFAIVSRQVLIESRFSTVMCVPVYTAYDVGALAAQKIAELNRALRVALDLPD